MALHDFVMHLSKMTSKMNFKIRLALIICFFKLTITNAQTKAVNYLNISNPLKIENKEYDLVWSSHPNQNYFKQEYLTSDQTLEKYKKMVLIEFVKGDFKLENVIQQKVSELEELKKNNPIVNFQVYENNDEYILDFLLSENSKVGKEIKIVERNIYRNKIIKEKGNNGIFLFAISEKGYENDLEAFFNNLKNNSSELIETVGNFNLPNIKIK